MSSMLRPVKMPNMPLSLATRQTSHKQTKWEMEVREVIGVCLRHLNLC